jgi:hypothetical protein
VSVFILQHVKHCTVVVTQPKEKYSKPTMGIAERTATMRNCWSVGGSNGPTGAGVDVVADSDAEEACFSDERHRLQLSLLDPNFWFFCTIQRWLPPRSKGREDVCIPFTIIIIVIVFSNFTEENVGRVHCRRYVVILA